MVLTVHPGEESTDDALLGLVPDSTEIVRTGWVDLIDAVKSLWLIPRGLRGQGKRRRRTQSAGASQDVNAKSRSPLRGAREWVSRLLVTPDSRLGWIGPAVRAGLISARRRRPDVIYSTSPYMSAHLIAMIIAARTGVAWVADFRDPWRDNPFRKLGFASLERWDARLERMVLRRATHIVCNTPTMATALTCRMPFVAGKCSTILNGFDGELLRAIVPKRIAAPDQFVLTHCGQFYGPRSPTPWFQALSILRNQSPGVFARVHLVLIGPQTYDGRDLRDLARDARVGDRVHVCGQKTHAQALACMKGSDALMLSGHGGCGCELQVPNKLFEYLAIRRPIIAALPSASPAVDILRRAKAEAIVCAPDDAAALADAIKFMAQGNRVPVEQPWQGVERFARTCRAVELEDIFRHVAFGQAVGQERIVAASTAPLHSLGLERAVMGEPESTLPASFRKEADRQTPSNDGDEAAGAW